MFSEGIPLKYFLSSLSIEFEQVCSDATEAICHSHCFTCFAVEEVWREPYISLLVSVSMIDWVNFASRCVGAANNPF